MSTTKGFRKCWVWAEWGCDTADYFLLLILMPLETVSIFLKGFEVSFSSTWDKAGRWSSGACWNLALLVVRPQKNNVGWYARGKKTDHGCSQIYSILHIALFAPLGGKRCRKIGVCMASLIHTYWQRSLQMNRIFCALSPELFSLPISTAQHTGPGGVIATRLPGV